MNMVAFKSTWRNSSKPIDILIYHILSKMSMANCYKLFWWLLLMALLLYWRRMTTETASALYSSFPSLSGKVMYTSNTMESLKRLPPLNRGRTVSPNAMTLTKALYLVTAECDSIGSSISRCAQRLSNSLNGRSRAFWRQKQTVRFCLRDVQIEGLKGCSRSWKAGLSNYQEKYHFPICIAAI